MPGSCAVFDLRTFFGEGIAGGSIYTRKDDGCFLRDGGDIVKG